MSIKSFENYWVEIIQVRLAQITDFKKVQAIYQSLIDRSDGGEPEPFRAGLYKSAHAPTDWSIHLIWAGTRDEIDSSALGASLFSSMRELGIVNYSTWEKQI